MGSVYYLKTSVEKIRSSLTKRVADHYDCFDVWCSNEGRCWFTAEISFIESSVCEFSPDRLAFTGLA